MLDLLPSPLERALGRLCSPLSVAVCVVLYGERRPLCARAYARGDYRWMKWFGRGHCARSFTDWT